MLKHFAAWLAVILVIGSISLGLGFYKTQQFKAAEAAAKMTPEPMEAVATARARQGEWVASTRAIGTVVSLKQLELRNELSGTIAEMGFSSGDIVEKDQLLVQFDVRQENAALEAAQAEATLAQQNLERREALKKSAAYSVQEADKARADFAAATARALGLKVIIDKKRIAAPFKARIGITNLQPGTYLDAGTLIGKLQGVDDDAYVDFSLPQDDAAAIRVGTSVTLASAALANGSTTAKIVAEDDSIDASSRTVRFRAVATGLGGTLRPGTFVDVNVATSKPQPTVLVPLTALRRSPNGQFVFVVVEEDGKQRARQRHVETGPVQNEDIAVQKGLTAGELIATSGSFKLRDGLLVNAATPDTAGLN
jgi:membrane fusion protein (multidrug efflux system)